VPSPETPPPGPPAFQTAYVAGCLSLRGAGRRDETAYAADADYRRGWDQGYQTCLDDRQRYPRLIEHSRGG
jgi:hypothetical protein